MKAKSLLVILALASLGACAQSPVGQTATPAKKPAAGPDAESGPAMLTEAILYQFLLGELAGQRGDLALASDAYADLARKTRDVRIVRRATEIASYARRMPQAMEMARLWVELEPQSGRARQTAAQILIGMGNLDGAKPYLEAMLRLDERPVAEGFMQLHGLLARHKDKKAVLDLVKELAGTYPALPESRMAVAHAALNAGQDIQAILALDEALRLNPGWESAALLKGQALSRQGQEAEVQKFWQGFLERNPKAAQVRLAYAKLLAKTGRYTEARGEFQSLLAAAPHNPEFQFALGILAMQMNDPDGAEQYLGKALEQGYHDESLVRMYLGQVNEGRQRYEKALDWYLKIERGEQYFDARLKAAVVLGKLNRVDEGRALLRAVEPEAESEAAQIVQAEAQLLREARRYDEALAVLDEALERSPDAADLIYDHAMIADKLGRLDISEADLRRLIALQPDHAHAYNALGYTLVDRTDRLDEGVALLKKALELRPDDPFILDSMGWAHFKARRLDEAVNLLRRAFHARPDPEIAAHLGEALWHKGEREEARKVWQGSLRDNPDNDYLRETLSRFGQ
jgi:tetratricopeptide (TPR) repeat protein